MPTSVGEHQLLRTSLEQRHAKKIFKHDHVTADRALRDCQAVGRGSETEMLPGRLKCSERIERQPLAIHSSSTRGAFVSSYSGRRVNIEFIAHTRRIGQYGQTRQSIVIPRRL